MRKAVALINFYPLVLILHPTLCFCSLLFFHTDDSDAGSRMKWIMRDCKYDVSDRITTEPIVPKMQYFYFILLVFQLDELKQCKLCYYYSNAKPQDWFTKVCVR